MPTPMRKRPDDFEEMLDKMGSRTLMQHYTVGSTLISRWRKEIGRSGGSVGGMVPRAIPEDFHLYAPNDRNAELAKRYGTSESTIHRWRHETGIRGRPRGGVKLKGVWLRPVPEGFAEVAICKSNVALAALYRARSQTVARWRKETGAYFVKPKRVKEPKPVKETIAREPKKRKLSAGFMSNQAKARSNPVPPRDASIEGDAAQVLRAYAPVYRCDARGRQEAPQVAKRFWRYGATVLSPDELMERAKAKGWACAV